MSIFDDRVSMLEIWKQLRNEMNNDLDNASSAAERFNNLSMAILPVYFVGLGLVFSLLAGMLQTMFLFSLGFFPIILVALSYVGKKSLDDDVRFLIGTTAEIWKVEVILGLYESISKRLVGKSFQGDDTLFGPLPQIDTTEEFIELTLSGMGKENIIPELSRGYLVFIVFGVILTIVNYVMWGILVTIV